MQRKDKEAIIDEVNNLKGHACHYLFFVFRLFCLYGPESVRVVEHNDEPWFVAADVCRVLGIANPRDAIARLDSDERDDVGVSDAIGREQNTNIISESGLYNLIFRSNKPEAKNFKRWVTHDVLPSLRKGEIVPNLPVPTDQTLPPIVVLEQFFNALKDHDERITDHTSRIEAIEKSRGLEYWQVGRLQSAVRQVVARWRSEDATPMKYPPTYHTIIWAAVKRKFGRVPRIQEIPAKFFDAALLFVEGIGSFADFRENSG